MQLDFPGLNLIAKTRRDTAQDDLDSAALALFQLFLKRDQEFGFNADIVVEYPDINDPASSLLLAGPAAYVAERIAELERQGSPIRRVVLLTTFGDSIGKPLVAAGYDRTPVDMPAGPDFTTWFQLERPRTGDSRTLYLEAVNEADEKIRPSFALELVDADGQLRGGACGSINDRDGRRYCYLATMTLDTGLPPGAGTKLGEALFNFLRGEGIDTIHLGTQTAGPFYEKLGFKITHTVLPKLRLRQGADCRTIFTDLVMMERQL